MTAVKSAAKVLRFRDNPTIKHHTKPCHAVIVTVINNNLNLYNKLEMDNLLSDYPLFSL